MKKIRVLIIDDSALVREVLSEGLSRDPQIEIVGKAQDAYAARDLIVYNKPDVLTLDVEMPKMDGVEFLKRLMPQYPLPVVMVSSMTSSGASVTLEALRSGAVDYVLKPSTDLRVGLNEMMEELIHKIKVAASIDVAKFRQSNLGNVSKAKLHPKLQSKILERTTDKIIAIGASTGGTVALTHIISSFAANMSGTIVVQHMPPGFTKMFAKDLNRLTSMEVKEAENGDRIFPGRVLIAPGDYHVKVVRSGGQYIVKCLQGDKVNGHRPSVDVLFDSIAEYAGANAVGVVLTGMGRDGAAGALRMKQSGARMIAQDEATSVVFGMPKEAYDLGAVEELLPITHIADKIFELLRELS